MFDKVFIQPTQVEHVPYEKAVTINRAPTDESIRLWEEMKEKAYKNLLETVPISDNGMSGRAIVYRDHYSDQISCAYQFLLNGRKHNGEFKLNAWGSEAKRELFMKIFDQMALEISKQLMAPLHPKVDMLI